MRLAIRILRASAGPTVFIAVAVLTWYLVSQVLSEPEPGSCAPAAPAETPDLEQPQAAISQVDFLVAGANIGNAAPVFSSTSLRFAAPRPEAVPAQSPSPSDEDAGTQPQLVTLLDGGRGAAPAHLMDCTFDGGSYRCGACATDGDCPSGEGCVINYGKGVFECAPNECEDDSHCFPGFACRIAAGGAPGPVIRRCLQVGVQLAGQPCSRIPATRHEACEEGLLCVNHLCGMPCEPGARDACPDGHVCQDSPSGAACLPDCRKLGCTGDKQCAQLNGGAYQCLDLVVDECSTDKPCPGGESCIVRGRAGRAGRFCAATCQSWKPDSCPGGRVCGVGGPTGSACYAKCDPQDLSTCPSGWLCTTVSEDLQTWGCLPDFH